MNKLEIKSIFVIPRRSGVCVAVGPRGVPDRGGGGPRHPGVPGRPQGPQGPGGALHDPHAHMLHAVVSETSYSGETLK